ncbi:hypothetical protein BH11PSE12_BH11PSE12_19890 [soil metagenome]
MPLPVKKIALACAVNAAFSTMVWAQQEASTSAPAQNVTVTANKRPQLLTDVAQSVQAISEEQLRAAGVVEFSDIVQLIPGASQTFKTAPGFETLQMRGISSGELGDALIAYYLDEIPFSLPNTQFIPPVNVFDVARVEVLRGPQGTLYGQSAMGGAVKLVTRKPNLSKFEAGVDAGFASTDGNASSRLDFMLNSPIKTDTLALRITGGSRKKTVLSTMAASVITTICGSMPG